MGTLTTTPASEIFTGLPRSTIHELRTPLTSIRGYAQLLLRGVKSPEQAQRAYETIFRESDRLAAMLNQLSSLAEARSGTSEPKATRFDLERLTASVVEQAQQRWPEHIFVHQGHTAAQVYADPRRIAELLGSLLDNAAGYSESGTTVETSVQSFDGQAHVAVRDQGIGIPPGELEEIFRCFRCASNVAAASANGSRGLGLGLFLARAAATQAQGQLWAESKLGRGSTFHLSLPLAS